MMTRIASLVLCLAAAAQSYLVYVPRAPHSLYQLPWLAAEHGIHPDTVDYECQADGVFPDLASHCKKYFVCNAGTVSRNGVPIPLMFLLEDVLYNPQKLKICRQ